MKSQRGGDCYEAIFFKISGELVIFFAQAAQDEGIEHIVMGTRGLGSIQGLLLGSVAMKVIHLAEVPITLIK